MNYHGWLIHMTPGDQWEIKLDRPGRVTQWSGSYATLAEAKQAVDKANEKLL